MKLQYVTFLISQAHLARFSEAGDNGFSNTCVGHRLFLLSLWLAVTIKIQSNHKKSVEVCGNDVTVWTPHKWHIGVNRNLFPGCPTQTM